MTAVNWVGGNGDWGVATNWSNGKVPTSSDDVTIDVPGSNTITISSGSRVAKSLSLSETLTISGGNLNVGSNGASVGGAVNVSGGTLSLNGAWSNSGSMALSSGTLNLGGTFAASSISSLSRTGGTVNLTGTLDNTGNTLTLDSSTGSWNFNGGTLKNGTLALANGSTLNFTGQGTFDGITLSSDFAVPNAKRLNVLNGLTFSGGSTLSLNSTSSASSTYLRLIDTQTIGGSGTIELGGTQNYSTLVVQGTGAATPATVTIGSGVTVRGRGHIDEQYAGDTLVNQGSIVGDVSGGTLYISPGALANSGTIRVSNGALRMDLSNWSSSGSIVVEAGTFNVYDNFNSAGGSVTVSGGTLNFWGSLDSDNLGSWTRTGGTVNLNGTLDNSGNTLTLTSSTGSWNLNGGTIAGGTVATSGGAQLAVSTSGTLDGVTLNTDITVPNLKSLTIVNGLTLNGTITLDSTSTGSSDLTRLWCDGTQTISGSGTIVLGGTASNATMYAMSTGVGNATLTIGSGVTVRGKGFVTSDVSGGGDSIVNQGTFIADQSGQILKIASYLTATNQGMMKAASGGWLVISAYSFSNDQIVQAEDDSVLTINAATYVNSDRVLVFGTGTATVAGEDVGGGSVVSADQDSIEFTIDQVAIGIGGSYRVERSLDGVNFDYVETLGSMGSTYLADNLDADTSYWFRIIADNGDGSSVTYTTGELMTAA